MISYKIFVVTVFEINLDMDSAGDHADTMGAITTPFFSAEGCWLCLSLGESHSLQILLDYASPWSAWFFLNGRRLSGFLHWGIVRGHKKFYVFVDSITIFRNLALTKKSFRLFYFADAN